MRKLLLLLWLGISPLSHAWSGHFLITDMALHRPEYESRLKTEIEVEPVESFLSSEGQKIAKLFTEYYDWLGKNGSKRFLRVEFDVEQPTAIAFLRAARLNPTTHLRSLRRLFPGEVPDRKAISLSVVSPWERIDKNFATQFEPADKEVSVRSILTTFSDEPDWEIDHDLWNTPQYGYGKMPYGKVGDSSSGAAFHMQFAHENWLVRKLVPTISDGMAAERIELFTRLSRLAFLTHHPYWGYRFAAWAIHYIQDSAQPYHSKAVPSESWWYYLKFAISTNKAKMISDTTQLVANRHYLFEDFVRGLSEEHYKLNGPPSQRIFTALADGPAFFNEVKVGGPTEPLFEVVSSSAAEAARRLDRAVRLAYGARATEDPTYDMEKDPQYDNLAIYRSAKRRLHALMKQTVRDLVVAGLATRTLLRMCQSPSR